ncbi:preprotein translocase subunit SecE [Candidatus Daviesbacteria bacterium RIFCSPHIGHO2_01_FULL_37_27]|nr:MAG: preprotein translocase subunit SecE [Candidatus Daviesbacteria bacterium GWA1_38_6]OGE16285.1 MAG: preprotein translocase subunit SecE [Candidatus Daviesbacteria bacterium RIFCSPHIGHO2_01_FULL_37_27]OGE45282.1 MAG: preprotein translocase subunit SecE [Candidatus Daviesbacteria bacterium RIFCSPLOWO2_01_FULL_37_10]
MNKIVSFLKEAYAELSKVVWPTREQTIRYSFLVIVVALVVGLILGGLDYGLTLLQNYILKNYGR